MADVTFTNLAAYEAGLADGRAEQRAADIAALRDRERWLDWWRTHPIASFDESLNSRAADYLESLGASPTGEAGDA